MRQMYSRNGEYFGTMGEMLNENQMKNVNYNKFFSDNLHVGDLVVVHVNSYMDTGIIVKSNDGNHYVMGLWGKKLSGYTEIKKVLPNNLVTDEILYHLHKIKVAEPKRMTMEEIREELGYPFIIVRGDE